jgi:hypothetical protein
MPAPHKNLSANQWQVLHLLEKADEHGLHTAQQTDPDGLLEPVVSGPTAVSLIRRELVVRGTNGRVFLTAARGMEPGV